MSLQPVVARRATIICSAVFLQQELCDFIVGHAAHDLRPPIDRDRILHAPLDQCALFSMSPQGPDLAAIPVVQECTPTTRNIKLDDRMGTEHEDDE